MNGAEQGMDRGRTGIGRLCSACVSGTGVDGGGVSVFSTMGAPVFLHATDATSRTIEDLQFTLGEGPCVDAASSGKPVHVPDLGAAEARPADRWPGFISEVAETDARALFAFPIRVGDIGLGVVDLYRRTPGELDPDQVAPASPAVEAMAGSMLSSAARRPDLPADRPPGRRHGHGPARQHHRGGAGPAPGHGVPRGHAGHPLARDVIEGRHRFTKEER